MLILTMCEDDRVLIPQLNITVMLTKIDGNKIRVGFDAPKEIKIMRESVLRKIETEGCNQP